MNVQPLLKRIREACTDIFGPILTGVYVHGSLAFGCFTWATGDIDFLVVVEAPPSPAQKEALITCLLALDAQAPPKGFEMSVVLASACREFVHPAPYELHFSNAHRSRALADLHEYCANFHGVDPDLAAHFTVTRAVGFPLCGAPVSEVFAPVPREAYLDSVLCDVADAPAGMRANPVYYTLNLCRVAAYLAEELVVSKRGGGEWALTTLPQRYAPLIRTALAAYAGGTENLSIVQDDLTDFAAYMLARISSAAPSAQRSQA